MLFSERLIRLDHVGAPITNALVPSIGSIDHLRLLEENLSSNSSPIIESLGNFLFINNLIYFSKARSKLVTGSKSFFVLDLLLTLTPELDLLL